MVRFCFLFFAVLGVAANRSAAIDTNQHVILITIDGCGAFYFDDPKAPLVNVRKLAAEGVVAKGMHVSSPAVTWPNHTTLVTGVSPAKHSVLYNGLMLRTPKDGLTRDSERTQKELIAVPTVFDFVHGKGFTTAGINWPCTPGSTTLDVNFPDVQNQLHYMTPQLIQELTKEKILDDSSEQAFTTKTAPKRDVIWAQTACYVLRTRRPNLMLLHFLITDSTQHQTGPQCAEAYDALGMVDQHIGELIQTLDETGLRKSTSIIITADHGFARVHKHILGTTALHKAGLFETDEGKRRVQIIPEGGTGMVYLLSEKTKEADRQKVIDLFRRHEGVEQIVLPNEYANYGMPSPEKNPQMADLVLCAKDGYSFSTQETENETIIAARGKNGIGAHGYLATNPKMNALFVATGRGIVKGKKIALVENIDVAPTVAHLLGENLPNADGKVLQQILVQP